MSYQPENRVWQLLILFLAAVLFPLTVNSQVGKNTQPKTWTIVIDPGHGGSDPGAISSNVKEKDINLAVALKLGKLLAEYEHTKVFYTRETDVAVDLYKRPQIANDKKADLFISLHCNAVESTKPYGAETYVMGLHKTKANLEVARKENAVILLEENYSQKYGGFDPNSPESDIIFSLYQNAFLNQSITLASILQKEFNTTAQRFDRGVKQAGFLVLYKINMPGILVEMGFITNENERKYLVSDAGKTEIAGALLNSILAYREKVDGTKPGKTKNIQSKQASEPTTTVNTASADKPDPIKQPEEKQEKPTKTYHETNTAQTETKSTQQAKTEGQSAPQTYFAVQFLASKSQLKTSDPIIKGVADVHFYEIDGLYRYVSGHFNSQEEAVERKTELQNGNFKDAFVVAFHKGKRISITEANSIIKK